MLRLLGLVISIGLADGMNPSSIGPALYLASGPGPRRAVLEFTGGYVAVMVLAGLILTLGPGRAILALVPTPGPTARYILETIAGVSMLVVAAVVWLRRANLGNRQEKEAEARFGNRSPAFLGATISAVEMPTAFPYFAAIAAVVGSGLGVIREVILVIVYNACFALPLLVIVGTIALSGERAVGLLVRARAYMHAHWPQLVAAVALLAGVIVTTLGATGLELNAGGGVGTVARNLHHLITHGSLPPGGRGH
jgi:cytochrome c biogenesis protein CcdA